MNNQGFGGKPMNNIETLNRLYNSTKQFVINIQSMQLPRGKSEGLDKLLDLALVCDLYIKRNPL